MSAIPLPDRGAGDDKTGWLYGSRIVVVVADATTTRLSTSGARKPRNKFIRDCERLSRDCETFRASYTGPIGGTKTVAGLYTSRVSSGND